MKRLIHFFAYTVIVLFILSGFGWLVKHSVEGTKEFGEAGKVVVDFVSFFDLFEQSVEEVKELPRTFKKTPDDFTEINQLEEDLFILTSYSDSEKKRTITYHNLKTGEDVMTWQIDNFNRPGNRVMNPLMLPDTSLIYAISNISGFYCIDREGELIWEQKEVQQHHSMNLDHEGNLWVCTNDFEGSSMYADYGGILRVDGRPMPFLDNFITKLDAKTGEILFHKSILELILENDLERLYVKSGRTEDPIHLNDIEPSHSDGPYWNRGDLFISMRNNSTVLQYRPSTNEIIKVLEGPFQAQHDVDIINDSTLCIFNNNAHQLWPKPANLYGQSSQIVEGGDIYSNLVYYHLNQDKFEVKYKDLFERNQIYTFTEGLSEHDSLGRIFIEEQNSGVLWVIEADSVIYKGVLHSHHEGYHHLPNWARLME